MARVRCSQSLRVGRVWGQGLGSKSSSDRLHYKAGTEPPPSIMSTTSPQQGDELNRLIPLMNAVNCEITFALITICAHVTQVESFVERLGDW
jgi:hypothetical protein